jgi:hypothetical protein
LAGIVNAAVWFGSAVFLVIGLPAVFTPKLRLLLTDPGPGFVAEAIIARFFKLQYWCGGMALALLLAQWFHCGRLARRWNTALVAALLALALAGGLWVQPRMNELHVAKYFGKTPEARARAGKEFALWHGASESANLVVIAGLLLHLWQVSRPPESPRFGTFSKIRG